MNCFFFMRGTLVLTLSFAILLLFGCALPLLPGMQPGLNGSQNRFLSASRLPAADAAAVCDRAAFEAGYKTQYARHWNWAVHDKEVLWRLKSRQNPGNRAAQWNYALYRGKELKGQESAAASNYGLQMGADGRIRNDCEARSFTQGETAGMRAAGQDLQKLAGEEL